jgi:hypothetical protein
MDGREGEKPWPGLCGAWPWQRSAPLAEKYSAVPQNTASIEVPTDHSQLERLAAKLVPDSLLHAYPQKTGVPTSPGP